MRYSSGFVCTRRNPLPAGVLFTVIVDRRIQAYSQRDRDEFCGRRRQNEEE